MLGKKWDVRKKNKWEKVYSLLISIFLHGKLKKIKQIRPIAGNEIFLGNENIEQ